MRRLIKYELKYNMDLIIPFILLPLAFAVFVITDTKIFLEIHFIQKYFWSIVVGLGSYLFIYIYLAKRTKEKRDRINILLPIPVKSISLSRLVLLTAPFIFIIMLINIINPFADKYWSDVINGLQVQVSLLFIFIAALDIVYEISFVNLKNLEKHKLIIQSIAAITTAVISFGVIYLNTTGVLPGWGNAGNEINFALAGLIFAAAASLIFNKRDTYTG